MTTPSCPSPPELCLSPDARRPWAVFSLLALLVGLAYGNCLQNGFAQDDNVLILKNGLITRLDALPALLASDYWITYRDPFGDPPPPTSSGLYRPLVSLSYALNYALGGLTPWGYHLLNVLLHVLVTWVLYRLACRLGFPAEAAFVGAAVFAVHPLHTEAVTNVVGRAELFMALGVLGSLWFAATGRRGWCLAAFAAGHLSKEQAVILPALLVLLDLCQGRFRPAARWMLARYGGLLLVLAGCLVIRWAVFGGFPLPPTAVLDNPLGSLPWLPRALTAFKVGWRYLSLFFWPAGLSLDYSYDAIPAARSLLEREVLLGLCAWGGLAGGMVWCARRKNARATFALGLTILAFLPVSNLVVLIGTIMGERLFYLPSAGLCLLAGLAYDGVRCRVSGLSAQPSSFSRQPSALIVLRSSLAVLCLAMIVRTAVRNLDWVSQDTAYLSAERVAPGSAKVNAYLGKLAAAREAWEEADRYFETALRLHPEFSLAGDETAAVIGATALARGDVERALDILERTVAQQSDNKTAQYHTAQYHLGLAYARAGRYGEAEAAYRRSLALAPDAAEGYNGLSYALGRQQRYAEAEAMAAEAVRLRSGFAEAHYNRGYALERLGRTREAVAEYERVLALSPAEEGVRARLARLRAAYAPGPVRKEGAGEP